MKMAFPIIPIIAALGIIGGVAAIAWYLDLSEKERRNADRLALKWFGQRFQELAEYQQDQVRNQLA